MAGELVTAVHGDQRGHGDEATVALGQPLSFPDVAVHHGLGELDEPGRDLTDFAAGRGSSLRYAHGHLLSQAEHERSHHHLSRPTHARGGNSAPIQSGATTNPLRPPTPEGETALQYRAESPPSLSGHPRPRGKQRSNTERSHHHLSQATHARGGNSAPIQR